MSVQPYIVFDYDVPAVEPLPEIKNEVRCHETGSPNVKTVCHHTGRFLSPAAEGKPAFYQDHSLELAGILKGKEARAAHSKTHTHYLPYSPLKVLIIPGLILTLWGIALLINLLPKIVSLGLISRVRQAFELLTTTEAMAAIGTLIWASWATLLGPVTLLIVGVVLLVVGINQRRIFYKIGMSRPLDAIPLLSQYYSIVVNEEMRLQLKLSASGDPSAKKINGQGQVTLEIYLDGQDIEQARKVYRTKGEKFGFKPINDFNLGWLYVKPSPYTHFKSDQHLLAMRRRFDEFENPDFINWFQAASYDYTIAPEVMINQTAVPEKTDRPILWVRPILKKFSGGHTLQIEFDTLEPEEVFDQNKQHSRTSSINREFLEKLKDAKLLCLQVKVEQYPFPGSSALPIERSRGRVSTSRNEVQWQNLRLGDVLTDPTHQLSDTYPLTVTFSESLTRLKSPLEISFRIAVEGSPISGIGANSNYFWLPNGHSAQNTKRSFTIQYNTYLEGTVLVEPDILAFEQEIAATNIIEEALSVPLTSEVITTLVKELEKDTDAHVKSVVKYMPVTEAEGDLGYQKRSWNILGRVYTSNNHPLDFYIILASRTPLLKGQTTTWGSVSYRCLEINRNSKNGAPSLPLQKEIEARFRKPRFEAKSTLTN